MSLVVTLLLAAFVIGGIPFGLLIARAYGVKDIRRHGSGNIGATNVWRVVGRNAALWVYLFDIGKGVLAVSIARLVDQSVMPRDIFLVLAAAASVFGHIFSPFVGFKGGKGVNTALGVLLVLLPVEGLISFGVFVIVVAISRYISLGSMVAAATLFSVVLFERFFLDRDLNAIYIALTLVLLLTIIYTHRENIRRLINGTESKFSLSSRSAGGGGAHV
ncbi:MAG: glycerol-3-phosphate 1-O-acyltransferase PlsY [candidate division Zixibacteria bacterium]|nr:glycerol-3-phosphate 1-O-acyltransferase PlsY [candidate division Zixibacteria bacterium]